MLYQLSYTRSGKRLDFTNASYDIIGRAQCFLRDVKQSANVVQELSGYKLMAKGPQMNVVYIHKLEFMCRKSGDRTSSRYKLVHSHDGDMLL